MGKGTTPNAVCTQCDTPYHADPCAIRAGTTRFCSKACFDASRRIAPSPLVGTVFHYLTVIGDAVLHPRAAGTRKDWCVPCRCICGKELLVRHDYLMHARNKSCGCMQPAIVSGTNRKHGQSKTRLYNIWCGMHNRCYNTRATAYPRYGGRGIVVCGAWHDFTVFQAWALSHGYTDESTIDRIDNDASYSPENCRFVDLAAQARNTSGNRYLRIWGETQCVAAWAQDARCRVTYDCLRARILKGWDPEDAMLVPRFGKNPLMPR